MPIGFRVFNLKVTERPLFNTNMNNQKLSIIFLFSHPLILLQNNLYL